MVVAEVATTVQGFILQPSLTAAEQPAALSSIVHVASLLLTFVMMRRL